MRDRLHHKNTIVAILGIGWIALILGLYYYRHKPISPDLAFSLVVLLLRSILCLIVLFLSAGVGMRILTRSRSTREGLGFFTMAVGLGFGILGTCFYISIRIFGATPLLAWVSLILLLIFLWRDVLALWEQVYKFYKLSLKSSILVGILGTISILFFLQNLVAANAPPLKFDALVYHLALPLTYIMGGAGGYLATNIFWGMPQLTESFFTWAMLLGGDSTGQIMSWAIGLIAFISLLGLMIDALGVRPAWVGMGALMGGITLVQAISWAYVEWSLILLGSACLAALMSYLNENQANWALLVGLLAGAAFGVKYTGGAILVPVCIGIFASTRKKSNIRIALYHTVWVLIGFTVLASPWLIKNLIPTGSPLYPFIFPAGAMSTDRLALYQGVPIQLSLLDTLLLPLQATIMGIEGGAGFGASIGPLLLGLGFLGLLPVVNKIHRSENIIQASFWIATVGILIWMTASRISGLLLQTRLFTIFFPHLLFSLPLVINLSVS